MSTKNKDLSDWVNEVAAHTRPEDIQWCDGSEEEFRDLIGEMLENDTLRELNRGSFPNCYLHLSDPTDVARVEHLTFVCTSEKDDAGPNNNWMDPKQAHEKVDALFDGCMKGRTMYVIPYCMGPIDSPLSRCGVEITDSPYVVVNMHIMTRSGEAALERIEREGSFVRGLHSTGDLDPERRYIMHFPEELSIKSIGSGYGGNALLGKKCHALRIASYQGRQEGWLAEHMLILGLESPEGETHYIAAAFPSACGKTNLAMMLPPESYKGWKVTTVGDDIAWLHPGEDGRMWAINPEAGYFGVVPGTSPKTNPSAYEMIQHDTIYTNVGITSDDEPWWEGRPDGEPVSNWKGELCDAAEGPAAHPNSRFTVSAKQNPSYSPRAEDPRGVPITAIVFGGRRRETAPLVYEANDWRHGVLVGAGMASETTAAATGAVGVVRRDPMAMKPFCGYNFADYWGHWLSLGEKLDKPPRVFSANWFREDKDGGFMWPGFGENIRVLNWIVERSKGADNAVDSAIGRLPAPGSIDVKNLDIAPETLKALTTIDKAQWQEEIKAIGEYLESYGERLPDDLRDEYKRISAALK